MMWTQCSTMTFQMRTSIISTASARRHGVAYSLVSSITEGIRLDDIRKNTGNEIRTVKLDAHGELTDVEKQ